MNSTAKKKAEIVYGLSYVFLWGGGGFWGNKFFGVKMIFWESYSYLLSVGIQPDSRHCAALHERGGRLLVPRLHSGAAHATPVLQQADGGGSGGPGTGYIV